MNKINTIELHEIFNEIKKNNKKKFEEFYLKYNQLIYKFIFSILKNRENSEDVMQKVFTKIFEMDKKKIPNENEISWIYALTKNETLEYIRNKNSDKNKKIDNETFINDMYYLQSYDKNIDNYISRRTYNKIMSKLGNEEQEIVSLKLISDLSFKEISQVLNKSLLKVKWLYYTSVYAFKLLLLNISMLAITLILSIKVINNEKLNKLQFSVNYKILCASVLFLVLTIIFYKVVSKQKSNMDIRRILNKNKSFINKEKKKKESNKKDKK